MGQLKSRITQGRLGKVFRLLGLSTLSLVISSFLLFSLLELFPFLVADSKLRAIPYYDAKARYVEDSKLVFRYRPFFNYESEYRGDWYSPSYSVEVKPLRYRASFDQWGFRNTRGDPVSDIVILGDSYMEIGVEESDTFAERLRKLTGLKLSNLGVSWYGPFQYLTVLKDYGVKRKPRYVVFAFFEGNDIEDITEYRKWENGGTYYWFDSTLRHPLRNYATAMTQVVRYLDFRISRYARRFTHQRIQQGPQLFERHDLYLVELKLLTGTQLCIFGHVNETRTPQVLRKLKEWQVMKDILKQFKQTCEDYNAIPIVLFIPTKTHIYARYSTHKSGQKWLDIRTAQIAGSENIHVAMARLSEEVGVRFLTLTPLFQTLASRGKLLYYPFDSHWNSEGREAAASFVAKELLR